MDAHAAAHFSFLSNKSCRSCPSLLPNEGDMVLLIIISLFILPVVSCAGTVYSLSGNETDHLALLAIKSAMRDSSGALSSWNHSVHHCYWDGIVCGHRHRRVVSLDLSSRGLGGTISPYIGNLSFLHFAILYNNTLGGPIPAEIGFLFRLYGLALYNNLLVGEIPSTISDCLNLQYLDISQNNLVGRLTGLGYLSMLKGLFVHENNLSGPIFPTIQNLTHLEDLSASFNSFEGIIPDTIGQMKNLAILELGSNLLRGMIPSSIYNLSSLSVLSLHYNQLHGSLPANIASKLPNLQVLNLAGNYFVGPLPASLSNISGLARLELSKNKFNGKVPWNLGNLKHLQTLQLSHNSLGGGDADDLSFVKSLVNCSNLEIIGLSFNHFGGLMPIAITNFSSKIKSLELCCNKISGKIPVGMSQLSNLVLLSMNNNQLSGEVPSDIGELQKLERIDFSMNLLSGTIPESWGNLTKLTELELYANNFQGPIPSTLGNCRYLTFMIVTQNNISGTIPRNLFKGTPRLIELGLAHNHLEGTLPFEVSQQLNLEGLDVSNNKLSGEIPSALGSCSGLFYLYMEANMFHGNISAVLSNLRSIQELDLSQNNLSGPIPAFLSKFALTYLNLSYNHFEGEIPIAGVFANTSAVSLFGNPGLCGGIPELHLPRCRENEATKAKISFKLKLIISCACALAAAVIVLSSYYICCIKKRHLSLPVSVLSLFREPFLKVSYNALSKATEGFSSSNLLGVGTFGSVFKGVLEQNEMTVAVKVLNLQQPGACKSFVAECGALRNVRHRNLVRIITVCSGVDNRGNDFKALVYEFMHGGSLESWLHNNEENHDGIFEVGNLNLLQRANIAFDVASALEYLHHECELPIVHRDLKPSNILLDKDMVAHVGDFGLAKFLLTTYSTHSSSAAALKGTIGYAAPEYGLGVEPSTASDIYSYGIVVLEMMTGKRPTDDMFKDGLNLHSYVKMALPDQVVHIVDPRLLEEDGYALDVVRNPGKAAKWMNCVSTMMKIGIACSLESPQDRMSLKDALVELLDVKQELVPGI